MVGRHRGALRAPTVHERRLLGWRAEGERGGVFRAEPTGEVDSARSIP